jgi:hypothetical protein
MPSRTEATRAKAALCATGRLTPLRLFSTLPVSSPFEGQRVLWRFCNSRGARTVLTGESDLSPKLPPMLPDSEHDGEKKSQQSP